MIWTQIDRYLLESDDGYRITKFAVCGVEMYEAWTQPKTGRAVMLRTRIKSADKAKELCEQHAKGETDAKTKA